jgi:hypothetical protein
MAFDDIENLFSYGTLQSEAVQLATFGRSLEGKPDQLIGYRVTLIPAGIPLGKHDVMATTGGTHHRNIEFTGIATDVVEGSVFPVTKHELEQTDAYERIADYKRVLVQLASGDSAWVYLSASTQIPGAQHST